MESEIMQAIEQIGTRLRRIEGKLGVADESEYLTRKDFADRLGVSLWTVDNWRGDPAQRFPDPEKKKSRGCIVWHVDIVDEYIDFRRKRRRRKDESRMRRQSRQVASKGRRPA